MEDKETIISIRETETKLPNSWGGMNSYSGYEILTNKQNIKFLIENEQSCCEDWGYFSSEDNLEDFIGAELLSIDSVDDCLNVKKLNSLVTEMEHAYTMFININTNKGTLQLVAYNDHNGYYGHEVRIISKQLNQTEIL